MLFHAAVPALGVVSYGASPVWLLGSLLFSIAVLLTAQRSKAPLTKTVLCLVSGISVFLNLMLGVSYYMQGSGFNDQYFFHLDIHTLAMAASAYGGVFYPSVFYLVLAFFTPLILYRQETSRRLSAVPAVVLWVGALALAYPLHSLLNYRFGSGADTSSTVPQIPAEIRTGMEAATLAARDDEQAPPLPENADPVHKNIIFIYAEGLEQLYFDREIFGDVVPKIRELSEQAHRFTNVYQMPGTEWTIAGIVASQCGFPLFVSNHMASNSTMASTEKPFEGEKCLADILQEAGYETVYMGGAPLAFAGKGNFLKNHGYEKVLGRADLTPRLPDPDYGIGWGLHDDSLFGLALEELRALEDGGTPYLLTVLTLGTHHPGGYVSKSCESMGEPSEPMSEAIFCSDQLISDFIGKTRELTDPDETVIVLFSDHLAMRNTLWDKLQEHKDQRRLMWMVFDNQPLMVSDSAATHFDVAPTVLEMAGVTGHPGLGVGVSLLARQDSGALGGLPEVDFDQVPRSLVSNASVKESGFGISYDDLTISVGDLAIRATKNGWQFETGLFLMVFNEDGSVADTIYSNDFARLIQELDGSYVVGISIHGEETEYGDQYFFGRLSPDLASLKVQTLESNVRVDPVHLGF
jgi:phosphoglycerol transferase